ncbi:hypothetical protein GCM10017600_12910 [Streptosporangium carneum]|uniref:Transcriptional regulator n=1 Tax=Streptosporangium carneum TaxID=47481 RepID=A0A9W6MB86_9ACTN|nr:hypothetical protein GCM10017600_12910 [Streptosporangium carneum]
MQITPSRVKEYIDGKVQAQSTAVVERIADGLRIPGEMFGLAPRPWETVPVWGPVSPPDLLLSRTSEESCDYLSAIRSFRSADRQFGGSHLYAAVIRYLSDEVAPRLFGVDARPAPSGLYVTAASLTEMAGWMAHDSGRDDLAAVHFHRALPFARAAADPSVEAHVYASMAHLSREQGRHNEAVQLARTGIEIARRGEWYPALYGRLYLMEARGLAGLCDSRARKALVHAEECIKPHDVHPWISPYDRAFYSGEAALCLDGLGDLSSARRYAEEAVELRREGRARSLALGQLALARIHTRSRELDRAVAVGCGLLDGSQTLGSVRVLRQLDELGEMLQAHNRLHSVRAFLDKLAETTRTRKMLLGGMIVKTGEAVP